MKKKDIVSLHDKEIEELKQMAQEAQKDLFLLKLDLANHKLKNMRSVFQKRKDIARILTVLRKKQKT